MLKAHEETVRPECASTPAGVGGASIHWWGLGLAASVSLADANAGLPLTRLTNISAFRTHFCCLFLVSKATGGLQRT